MAGVMQTGGWSSLTWDEQALIAVILLNALVVIAYRILMQFRSKERRGSCNLKCVVMLLCPVVGICFFLFSWCYYRLFLHASVDLADVIFSKERVKTYLKADENKESNFVPLEEAITVTDKESTRTLMMEVVRRDVSRSLSTIALALNSEDSEVSHYAASVLQDTLDKLRLDFRHRYQQVVDLETEISAVEQNGVVLRTDAAQNAAKELVWQGAESGAAQAVATVPAAAGEGGDTELYREENVRLRTVREALEQGLIARDGKPEEAEESLREKLHHEIEEAHSLLSDIYQVLRQKVFSTMEQASYTQMMEEMARIVDRRDLLTAYELEEMILHYLSMGEYDNSARWCVRTMQLYPDTLSTYTCRLKLSFAKGDRETFFTVLDELKKTSITLDHETLELVRAFSNRTIKPATPETA